MRVSTAVTVALSLVLSAVPLAGQTPPAVGEGRALRIGMIGAGPMGAPIGLALAEAGHQVMLSSRNPAELMPLVQQAAPRGSAGYADAAAYFADVIVLAVPPSAIPQLGQDYGHLMRARSSSISPTRAWTGTARSRMSGWPWAPVR